MPVLMQKKVNLCTAKWQTLWTVTGLLMYGKSHVTLQRKFWRQSIFNISKHTCGFWCSCDLHHDKFLKIKPIRCTNFSNFFWNETLHVSDSSSVHHQESSTVYTTRGICHTGLLTACEQDQYGTYWFYSQTVYRTVWYVPLLCLQGKPPGDGQRISPKHVEFHSKKKLRN